VKRAHPAAFARAKSVPAQPAAGGHYHAEVECLPGLEDFVRAEVAALLPGQPLAGGAWPGRLALDTPEPPWELANLRCAVAVHQVLHFDVPRPKALLGHQHFARLLAQLRPLVARQPAGAFSTVRVSAAGADSAVFVRLRAELERELGLSGTGRGDLLLSFRRPADGTPGWEVLVRTTPLPLSARAWRVCSLPGALNATVAQAMVRLARPRPDDRFLSLACGSGTFLVERLQTVPARLALGLDISREALRCARANLEAGGCASRATLLHADATAAPLPNGCMDTIVVDLPFGMLVGNADENRALYPALLRETARVARLGAVLVAVTAARRLFETCVVREVAWRQERALPVRLPYKDREMTVGVYLLRRI